MGRALFRLRECAIDALHGLSRIWNLYDQIVITVLNPGEKILRISEFDTYCVVRIVNVPKCSIYTCDESSSPYYARDAGSGVASAFRTCARSCGIGTDDFYRCQRNLNEIFERPELVQSTHTQFKYSIRNLYVYQFDLLTQSPARAGAIGTNRPSRM